ncbi:uncharacterized protein LOC113652095 [Tachysurus fulvidraco]|uniref:uncharacterized protein LOC113652095 n=1 Tax=Tachysurus fulvidraco TaxID=1234273 RepID=UPI001FEE35EB|nr:uncharacterized protein LOC113652095 [Tachysurus fulvidraco]
MLLALSCQILIFPTQTHTVHTSGHVHASRMLHMLSGLLSLLLDLALISGQTANMSLIITEGVVKNGVNKLHHASHSNIPVVNGKHFDENIKDNVTYEEQENFQDQEKIHHYGHYKCDETLLRLIGKEYCSDNFDSFMTNLTKDEWCDFEMVLSYYNDLTHCLENVCAVVAHCYYPNAVVQEMFVEVHKQYFNECVHVHEEEDLSDAPAIVVLILTLLPVSVIPMLVHMVIWKSSVID